MSFQNQNNSYDFSPNSHEKRVATIERIQEEQLKGWQQLAIQMAAITEELKHISTDIAVTKNDRERIIRIESRVEENGQKLLGIEDRSSKIFFICLTTVVTALGGLTFKYAFEPHFPKLSPATDVDRVLIASR